MDTLNLKIKSSQKFNNKLWITEFFLYDQFSEGMQPLISQYQTTQSICGYTAVANAIKAAQLMSEQLNVEQIIQRLSNVSDVYFQIEIVMGQIQNCRTKYLNQKKINNQRDRAKYLQDWVANFEISDYLSQEDKQWVQNIWFMRNVAHDHPQEMLKATGEEKDRLPEEKQFTGKGYFFECFYPQRELLTIEEFQELWHLQPNKENQIFIIDLLGHFNIVMCGMRQGQLIINMCDTTNNTYIDTASFTKLIQIIQPK